MMIESTVFRRKLQTFDNYIEKNIANKDKGSYTYLSKLQNNVTFITTDKTNMIYKYSFVHLPVYLCLEVDIIL